MKVPPPWLEGLLKTAFFKVCRIHGDGARSECNMYCLECDGAHAFCFYCRSSNHRNHQVIQIRRSSYHDVVRVSEIEKVLEISGVQSYVINSARVLFLNQRPLPRATLKPVSHLCQICRRTLLDSFLFCSLACKVIGIKRNGDAKCFWLEGSNEDGETMISSMEEKELREVSQQEIYTTTHHHHHHHSRRRKGIPQRAPFGSTLLI